MLQKGRPSRGSGENRPQDRGRGDGLISGPNRRPQHRAGRLVVAPDKPSSLEMRLASGPLQGSELQGCTLVIGRYAGIAVFDGLIMALTIDPCKPLKTRGGGRGSKLTLCATAL
jgi:hypothetical protein